jgi:tRNA(Ile)-lysidine synthase
LRTLPTGRVSAYNLLVHKFVRNLITEWRRLELPISEGTVVVAVSGGADSVSLLLGLDELKTRGKLDLRIVAAHFNHRLRGAQSDADEEFVRGLTTKLKTELAVGAADISTEGNLEQNARHARYDFLCKISQQTGALAVATGHTINDQAETFLMNLVRGSGPDGLRGMKPVRPLEAEREFRRCGEDVGDAPTLFPTSPLLVRPLLTWAKRIHTEGFCRDQAVEYRYDTMNEDTAFRRVRIRKILLPLLEDMNPNIVETLANTAGLMPSTSKGNGVAASGGGLKIADLKQLPEDDIYGHIRSWLADHRGGTRALGLKHIQAVERLALSTKSGRVAQLPGGASVLRSGGRLIYRDKRVEN